MEAKYHLLTSFVIGYFVVNTVMISGAFPLFVGLVAFATACGTLIDLDHFLWARYNQGDWRSTWSALRHPIKTMNDNSAVLNEDALSNKQRYASHFVILVSAPVVFFIGGSMVYTPFGWALLLISTVMFAQHIFFDMLDTIYNKFVIGR